MKKPSALRRALLAIGLSLASVSIPWHEISATVSDLDTQTITALGNGVTTNYTIGFTFHDNDHVVVYREEQSSTPYVRTLIAQGAGAAKFTISGGDPGTTVVMGTAPTSTQRLIIKRVTPKTQIVDYVETDAFPAEDHEEAMDKLVLLLQEIQADVDTKVGLEEASTADTPTFPDPVADRFLLWNATADDLTLAPSGSSSISSGNVLKYNGSAWATYDLDSALTTLANSLNSHIANVSNPHTVTAAQVGNTTAQWNANQINGVTVNNSSISSGFTLVYNGSQIVWQAPSLLPLSDGEIFVGDASNNPVSVPLSGDASIINTGALTVTGIQGVQVDDSAIADGFVLTYNSGSGTLIYGAAPLTPSLTSAHIFVGNAGNVATDVAVTGDIAISNAGVTSIASGVIVDADINASAAITRSKLAAGTASHVVIHDGSGNLSSEASLNVTRGGTGAATLTANNVILGNGTSAVQFVAPGTSGNVLTSNGTIWQSTAPAAVSYTNPTVQKFTTGSGTYTRPTAPTPIYIRVRMVGGGGGGGGNGTNTAATDGGTGGNTTFGTTLLVANGGTGGGKGGSGGVGAGGAGGTASLGAAVGLAFSGAAGGRGFGLGVSTSAFPGVPGASSVFGGAGPGNFSGGGSAATNSGSGGAGAGTDASGQILNFGGSGGAGGYVDAVITSPSTTYSYAVGALGTAGGAGASGHAGGAGGDGIIIVEEFYQ